MILVLPGAEVHPTWASRVGALHDSNVTPRFLQLGFAIFCFCKMVESWKLKMSSYPKGPWFWGSSCSLAPHFILANISLFHTAFSYYQCYDSWTIYDQQMVIPFCWAPVTSNDRCPHRRNDDAQRFQGIVSDLAQATLLIDFRDTWAIFMSCSAKDRGHTVQHRNWW